MKESMIALHFFTFTLAGLRQTMTVCHSNYHHAAKYYESPRFFHCENKELLLKQ